MKHFFDVEIAVKYGMNEAVVLGLMRDNNAYNLKEIKGMVRCLSEKQIRKALQHLVDNGLLEMRMNNEDKFDRTKYYYRKEIC